MSQLGLASLRPKTLVKLSAQIVLLLLVFTDVHGEEFKASGSPSHNSSAERALLACYNKDFSLKGSTFIEYVEGRPSRSLRLHRAWWSTRPAHHAISFFTPTDLSRLSSLDAQCQSLPGIVVAAAVWLPLIVTTTSTAANANAANASAPGLVSGEHLRLLDNAIAALEEMFAQNAAGSCCILRLLLLYELVVDEALAVLMPVNVLRNAAMLATDSRLVGMMDVDLSTNAGLTANVLRNPARLTQMLWRAEKQHVAWVMPAWDTAHHLRFSLRNEVADVALSVGAEEKYRLRDMWGHRKLLFPFAMERGYLPGHNATNYERWFMARQDYAVEYQEGYEPWFIAARHVVPLYDARFRGYYMNKLVATRHSSHLLNMRVLLDVWVVHRPHDLQVSNFGWLESNRNISFSALDQSVLLNGTRVSAREAFFERNRLFYKDAVDRMQNWTYVPVADAASKHCRVVLPWWTGGCPGLQGDDR